MKRLFTYVFLNLLFIMGPAHAFSQMVTVKASLDSNRITIGDQVNLVLEVRKGEDVSVQFPVFTDKLSDEIEIIGVSKIDSVWLKEEKKAVLKQNILITAFDSGVYSIPSLKIIFSDQNVTDTVESSPTYLEVQSFPLDTTGTIRDIKAVEKAPVSLAEMLPYVLSVLGAALLAAFLIYYFQKKKKNQPVFVREKTVDPPYVVAMKELDVLKAEKIWQRGQIKNYYSRLTEIIRRYVEGRFNLIAMEQTTEEILVDFEEQKILKNSDFLLLKDMLTLADLVKFAKADPSPYENESQLENAYVFVKNTRPPVAESTENPVVDVVDNEK